MTERTKSMFEEWGRKLLWALITGLVTYGVNEIKQISQSLQNLNITVTILSEKLNTASEASRRFTEKIDVLEQKVHALEIECSKK